MKQQHQSTNPPRSFSLQDDVVIGDPGGGGEVPKGEGLEDMDVVVEEKVEAIKAGKKEGGEGKKKKKKLTQEEMMKKMMGIK